MSEMAPTVTAAEQTGRQLVPRWASLGGVLALAVVMYLIRITAPPDLADDYHQERAAAYALDTLLNGHWICQYGAYGEVSSKPPMLTWLIALASLPAGHATWFTLTLPVAIATAAIAALIFFAGSRFFGRVAGFLAGVVYLHSMICARQIVQARIDGLFTLTVLVTALIGFRCWMRGTGWVWFWVAATIATLTKGPLGVFLAGIGFVAWWWERRGGVAEGSTESRPTRQTARAYARPTGSASFGGSHAVGLIIFLVITGGWFVLAYRAIGKPLVDVMVGRELVGHAVHSAGAFPGRFFYMPTLVFLSRFAPWSVLTAIGLWRLFKRPAADEGERRFERFVCSAFLGGLAIFSLAPHQRPDLIFPIIPFGALIAGRELSCWVDRYRALTLARTTVVIALITFSTTVYKYHVSYAKNIKVVRTTGLRKLADTVRARVGEKFPLIHVDSPFAFQVFLNTKSPMAPLHEAATLLRGSVPAFVAIADLPALEAALGERHSVLHRLAGWKGPGKEGLYIVSNHPKLEWTTDIARPRIQTTGNGSRVPEE